MSNLQPLPQQSIIPTAPAAGGRLARQTSRQIAALDAATEVRTAAIRAAAELQQEKVDAVARTGAYGMQQVTLVSQAAQQLVLAAPAASGDIEYLKTLTVMSVGQIITDTARQVNK
ncbi:MAG: hypothetical protein QM809_17210 [Gordonia sp. (in: high G+C Gram-positive bacteria)]|uniref:hypothetical protein n=1 Tax=Gordonia sp. (in: high G+C Gram-positive bacteria) TaxID=84139 RepID=UPI0039E67365